MMFAMNSRFVLTTTAAFLCAISSGFAADGPPDWAYGIAPDGSWAPTGGRGGRGAGPAADTSLKRLPGSTGEFTSAQISNGFGPADWFPNDHPPMPPVVANGRQPAVRACALCHYPNGKGRPENAGVSDLNVEYFIQQMNDFRHDLRIGADPRKANSKTMVDIAKAMTDEEIKASAEYFSLIKWTPWIRVVETDTVPKTRVVRGLFTALESGEKEPLGHRIMEIPENTEMSEVYRNPRAGFIAYVPVGSIRKGEALAKAGQCAMCHGTDLNGIGPVPGIAGRAATYIWREMYDFQHDTRKGLWSGMMKPAVRKLSTDDMIAVSAYVASVKP
jgi:cytochrome c553